MELTGFGAFMQFGLSFDYRTATWDGYYDIKSSLGAPSAAGGDEGQEPEDVAAVGAGAPGRDDPVDATRLPIDPTSSSDGGGGGDSSPPVLFSSDGFRELERYAAAAAKEEEEREQAREAMAAAAAARPGVLLVLVLNGGC